MKIKYFITIFFFHPTSKGQDCDVLIHEATMEDELEEDAKLKTHCTTSQAIQVLVIFLSSISILFRVALCLVCAPNFTSTFILRNRNKVFTKFEAKL